MKDNRDPGTIDLLSPAKRKPGPKSSGKAKSAAQRMREYRARTVAVSRAVLQAAFEGSSQVRGADLADGMDRLVEENRQLRARIAVLEDQLQQRNVTRKRK